MEYTNGHIQLHRGLLKWGWWEDHNTTRLFIYLLISANWQDDEWMGITVKRGQLVTGLFKLSKNTGISPQSIRTSLTRLKSTNEITIKSTNKYSVISINNYDKYQTLTSKLTNDQQTTNKQLTTNKEYKNIKKQPKIDEVLYVKELLAKLRLVGRTPQQLVTEWREYHEAKGTKIKNIKLSLQTWIKTAREYKHLEYKKTFDEKLEAYMEEINV